MIDLTPVDRIGQYRDTAIVLSSTATNGLF
jgi:hypothetical protein